MKGLKSLNEDFVFILEKQSSVLESKKNSNDEYLLEGIAAVFGKENNNHRIYEENEYLPHLDYLQDKISQQRLLGELDHQKIAECIALLDEARENDNTIFIIGNGGSASTASHIGNDFGLVVLKKTNKALAGSKKENDDYAKQVVEKMKKYVEAGSNGEFNESPEEFPESNYDLSKMKEKTMKYHPSQAVDEYIDAFAYPGQTNIVYDEIKPDDEKIEMYLKGNSKTGNAVKDKDGKALGNVVPSEVGEKFMKNYKDNLYGAEQMNVSYKRQSQPVDIAGEKKESGSLSSKRGGKNSTAKAQSIMNKLESTEDKKLKIVSEEMNKMKNLISYNRKTQ
jgi:hypothetical protein